MSILKKFDHIGIVVEDLEKATDELSFLFDLQYEEKMEMEEVGIRIAFYPLGVGQMELIEFTKTIDDVDPMVTQPRAGVQHVAFQVEAFDETLKELTEKGLKIIPGFPRKGAHGRVAFFYPIANLDLMIEICEVTEH